MQISGDLDFSTEQDYECSQILSSILGSRSRLSNLDNYIADAYSIVGNGPELEDALSGLGTDTVIVAGSAISSFMDHFSYPPILVTDLDGDAGRIIEASSNGTLVVVHGHGDNITAIRKVVPDLQGEIVGTTQNNQLWNVFNFFGFTDGDRAAFLADYLGADRINLIGFDFSRPGTKPGQDPERKLKKLKWAETLLRRLAAERGKVLGKGKIITI